jgi:hypothetical protein
MFLNLHNPLVVICSILSLILTNNQATIPQLRTMTATTIDPTIFQSLYYSNITLSCYDFKNNMHNMELNYIKRTNETYDMGTYVLFVRLTGDNVSHSNPDWKSLADEFDFRIINERTSQATVEASPETISLLQKAHPEIQVTVEKKYHKADVLQSKY